MPIRPHSWDLFHHAAYREALRPTVTVQDDPGTCNAPVTFTFQVSWKTVDCFG
jgi:hypothetical protein